MYAIQARLAGVGYISTHNDNIVVNLGLITRYNGDNILFNDEIEEIVILSRASGGT